VLAGAGIGSFCGYFIPHLHLEKKAANFVFSPTINGFYFHGVFRLYFRIWIKNRLDLPQFL
jgi:hypothetical protein